MAIRGAERFVLLARAAMLSRQGWLERQRRCVPGMTETTVEFRRPLHGGFEAAALLLVRREVPVAPGVEPSPDPGQLIAGASVGVIHAPLERSLFADYEHGPCLQPSRFLPLSAAARPPSSMLSGGRAE